MDIGQRWVTERDAKSLRRTLGRRSLILASGSPRRREVLKQCGVRFTVVSSGVEETIDPDHSPHGFVIRWSRQKARAVAMRKRHGLILGADTIVYLHRNVGKPTNPRDAARLLGRLSGQTHTVYTGLTLIRQPEGLEAYGWVTTRVRFHPLSDRQISKYVRTGEPLDKAGAYGIQGMGGQFVAEIDGPLDNVVGLPVGKMTQVLARLLLRDAQ